MLGRTPVPIQVQRVRDKQCCKPGCTEGNTLSNLQRHLKLGLLSQLSGMQYEEHMLLELLKTGHPHLEEKVRSCQSSMMLQGAMVSRQRFQCQLPYAVLQAMLPRPLMLPSHDIDFGSLTSLLLCLQLKGGVSAVQLRSVCVDNAWSVCFHIMRPDGTHTDFSYYKCLATLFPKWALTTKRLVRVPRLTGCIRVCMRPCVCCKPHVPASG